jgi:pyruvate/2-oxoglutarate/acetoin dehydrogenase E1 component/TPP-dependent pyruvate/acetoin dehydrogenase alpha subunit
MNARTKLMSEAKGSDLGIEPQTLRVIYTQIARIHEVDKAIRSGLASGKFRFTYWPMTGQEAIPATLSAILEPDEYMVTIYRGVHDQVAKGVSLKRLFAEMLGREDGVNKGKGGSPHVSDPASGSMLTTAIVGAGAPIANGLALAAKMRGEKRVTVVNFGDGATSIGAFHEALNLAALWKLPVVFLCQDNQIGEYTLVPDYTANTDFTARGAALGLKSFRLDGNDPVAFYQAMSRIINNVRTGQGPVFVDAVTVRLGNHAGIAETGHLTAEQMAQARITWPVPRTRALLLDNGICGEEELLAIESAAKAEVDEAIAHAMASRITPASEIHLDVFKDPDGVPRRGHFPVRAVEPSLPSGPVSTLSMAEAIRQAQDVAMELDSSVIALGEDIGDPVGGVFKTTVGLETRWGKERVRNTPIAEQAIIGAGTGAALVGMRPVAEIMFNDFFAVCLDQITNHAAKQRYMSGGATHVPLTIRTICGGGATTLGAQHSQSLEAWVLHTPGLKVVYPSTPVEAKGLLLSCIFDDDPCIHIESMALLHSLKEPVPAGDYRIPLGVAKVKRVGTDLTLISYGMMVARCLAVAEKLAAENISVEVIDLRTLMPLDYHRVLTSVRKTGRAMVVHLATEFCGLGSEIAATINEELFRELKAPASRYGADWAPIAYSREMAEQQIPREDSILTRSRALLNFSLRPEDHGN